jgi:hypothetical protein
MIENDDVFILIPDFINEIPGSIFRTLDYFRASVTFLPPLMRKIPICFILIQ